MPYVTTRYRGLITYSISDENASPDDTRNMLRADEVLIPFALYIFSSHNA